MDWLAMARWSPYVVGIAIGILSWVALLVSDETIGCSSSFARTSGMIERLFRGNQVLERPYFQKVLPVITWDWMLVLGLLIGASIAALTSGSFQFSWVPDLWQRTFGYTPAARWAVALGGGVLMGIGARWAGGCTSGHGISGTLQLAVSSWLAVICFFIAGITTAMIIFRVFG